MSEIESEKVSELPLMSIEDYNELQNINMKLEKTYNYGNLELTHYFSPIGKVSTLSEKPIKQKPNTVVDRIEYAGLKQENRGKEYYIEKELLTANEQLENVFSHIELFNHIAYISKDDVKQIRLPTTEEYKEICLSCQCIPNTIDDEYSSRKPLESRELLQNENEVIVAGQWDEKNSEVIISELKTDETNITYRFVRFSKE